MARRGSKVNINLCHYELHQGTHTHTYSPTHLILYCDFYALFVFLSFPQFDPISSNTSILMQSSSSALICYYFITFTMQWLKCSGSMKWAIVRNQMKKERQRKIPIEFDLELGIRCAFRNKSSSNEIINEMNWYILAGTLNSMEILTVIQFCDSTVFQVIRIISRAFDL